MNAFHINEELLLNLPSHSDSRGALTVMSLNDSGCLPFSVDRVFWITDVPEHEQRGQHAHRYCWEVLVPVHGQFNVRVDDGKGHTMDFTMNSPQSGLLIPPMVWCELYDFTPGTVCLCLASGDYDKEGYISDYAHFLKTMNHAGD